MLVNYDRLAVAINELTEPRVTLESVAYWSPSRHRKFRLHRVEHQSLLVELASAVVPGNVAREEGAGWSKPNPGSRPAARLDAVDALERIKAEVALWCERLSLRKGRGVAHDMRRLLVAGHGVTDTVCGWMALDARGWATVARVVTGWESPAFAPHVSCPACGVVGGLRIKLEARVACCLGCQADWVEEDGSIYVLARHVSGLDATG